MNASIPARLAHTGLDGFPRAAPIGFYWNGAQFITATATNAPNVLLKRVIQTIPENFMYRV